jgi:hypothetical protein
MNLATQQAIFATNAFADAFPEIHTQLWNQFESEVPHKQRSGYYGADNVAYIRWLKEKKNPVFIRFAQQYIESRSGEKQ